MRDLTVCSTVELAVRDHGGDGPAVLLLHGGGGNLLQWEDIAAILRSSHRVVALDLRGHGQSGGGPWEWNAVLDDLEAVIEHCDLGDPAVVGHSLGGMLAGMWSRRHPDCPGAVSLDGHRSAATYPENYAEMPPEQVHSDLSQLRALFDAQMQMMATPLNAEQVEAMLNQQRVLAPQIGLDAEQQVAQARRNLAVHNGLASIRPDVSIASTLRDAPEFLDCLPVFAEVTSPFLLVMATRNPPGLPPQFAALMDAYRAGLRRDLVDITRRHPTFKVHEIAASHAMVAEQPRQVADLVAEFLANPLAA